MKETIYKGEKYCARCGNENPTVQGFYYNTVYYGECNCGVKAKQAQFKVGDQVKVKAVGYFHSETIISKEEFRYELVGKICETPLGAMDLAKEFADFFVKFESGTQFDFVNEPSFSCSLGLGDTWAVKKEDIELVESLSLIHI